MENVKSVIEFGQETQEEWSASEPPAPADLDSEPEGKNVNKPHVVNPEQHQNTLNGGVSQTVGELPIAQVGRNVGHKLTEQVHLGEKGGSDAEEQLSSPRKNVNVGFDISSGMSESGNEHRHSTKERSTDLLGAQSERSLSKDKCVNQDEEDVQKETSVEKKNRNVTITTLDKSHPWRVLKALNEQRKEEKMCDVILKTQNVQYHVHKCVLLANSPFYETLIKSNYTHQQQTSECETQNPIVIPFEFGTAEVVDCIIEYMYTGQLKTSGDIKQWRELFEATEKIHMINLQQCCGTYLAKQIDTHTWIDMFFLAEEFKVISLQNAVKRFISDNIHVIAQDASLLTFKLEDLQTVLNACLAEENTEIDMYMLQLVLQWVQHSIPDRLTHYAQLLTFINTNNLSSELTLQVLNMVSGSELANNAITKELLDGVKSAEDQRLKDEGGSDVTVEYDVEYNPTDEGSDWSDDDKEKKVKKRGRPKTRGMVAKSKRPSRKVNVKSGTKNTTPKTKIGTDAKKRGRKPKNEIKTEKNENDVALEEMKVKKEIEDLDEDEQAILHRIIEGNDEVDNVAEPKPKKKRGRPPKQFPNGEKVVCPKCPRQFSTPNKLSHHLRGHGSDTPYLCELCGFSTRHIASYNLHKRKHAGKVMKCSFPGCPYTSVRRTRLEDHMNAHQGIKNHVCSICGKAFFARKQLNRHENTIHAGKKFFCDYCEYGTPRRDKLRYHMKKHHTSTAIELGYINAEDVTEWKKRSNRSGPCAKKKRRGRYDTHDYAAPFNPEDARKVKYEASRGMTLLTLNKEEQKMVPVGSLQPSTSGSTMLTLEGDRVRVQLPPNTTISEEMIQYLATYTSEQIQMHANEASHAQTWNYHVNPSDH